MDNLELMLRFLSYSTEFPCQLWDENEDALKDFEEQWCFVKAAQPLFTKDGLCPVLRRIQDGAFYEIEDILGIHLLLFSVKSHKIIIGPYVVDQWDDVAAEKRLMSAGLSASYLYQYRIYYCSYVPLSRYILQRIVQGAIYAVYPEAPPYYYNKISGVIGICQLNQPPVTVNPQDDVIRFYALEDQFAYFIREGHAEAAIEVIQGWFLVTPSEAHAKAFGSMQNLTNYKGILVSLRTILRREAKAAGVHVTVVDAISLKYAEMIRTAENVEDLNNLIPVMIREYADAVRDVKLGSYTLPIKNVIDYLRLRFSEEADITKLAAIAGCSPSLLRRTFKKETGKTISEYTAELRCVSAAKLLVETDASVQAISAYVGYIDNNYFVKVFRRWAGEPPSAYRKGFRH